MPELAEGSMAEMNLCQIQNGSVVHETVACICQIPVQGPPKYGVRGLCCHPELWQRFTDVHPLNVIWEDR